MKNAISPSSFPEEKENRIRELCAEKKTKTALIKY